ncbi:CoA pyrophosphatase [Candidatus Sororendozoicomonas aggregata]|uniref:CoA pyrophosphatase n=1 Tax=Candidatus Sororendozoicomonas aggregata TaxID=3073239 RepID=UPI002ED60E62
MLDLIKTRLSNHQPRTIQSTLPQAAVLIPVIQTKEPAIILTRRSPRLSTHSGEVAFPGGKRDADDSSLEKTALRESFEEIGLCPSSVTLVGEISTVVSLFGIAVTPFVGLVPEYIDLTPNADELDRIFTVPLPFLLDQKNLSIARRKGSNRPFAMPSYQYGEYTIWGLTAIMIVDFLNVTLDANIPFSPPPFEAVKQT